MRPLLPLLMLLPLAAPARAATDDTDFLFRMGLMEGHLMVGGELLDSGHPKLALPHFGHPVAELYDDIAGYLPAHGIAPFRDDLIRLEAAVAAAPDSDATRRRFAGMIGTLHRARGAAPAALRDSVPEMIRICADTVDAAAGEYGEAVERGRIASVVEYHDSHGYLAWVARELDRLDSESAAADHGLIARFRAVLARARWIVAPLMPDPVIRATPNDYRAIAADAAQIARH